MFKDHGAISTLDANGAAYGTIGIYYSDEGSSFRCLQLSFYYSNASWNVKNRKFYSVP